jgi:hypothetical protein
MKEDDFTGRREVGKPRFSGLCAFPSSCALSLLLIIACLASAGAARAEEDAASLFASATRALHDGRPGEAIGALEALADRGVVDPVASYDRGLAYATRVHINAEQPGDLGRAAHGFEEARDLSRDPRVVEDASRALRAVRGELARRRIRAGESVEVDAGRSLSRALASLLSEDTWAVLSAIASATFALGLLVRWIGRRPRVRIGGGVVAGVAAPVLALAIAMTLAARHDRWTLREAVVVTANARPTDDRGISLPGSAPFPEGARVEIVAERGGSTRVRSGTTDAWVSGAAMRELAR